MPNTDSSQAAFTQRKRGQALGIFHAANPNNNRNGPQSTIPGSVYHVIQIGNASIVGPTAPTATVPDAPTIGTATSRNAQASVTFTAPASDGGSDITSYTVTSSPGGFTASGPSSPLMVTGLTNGTAYTFTVVATNSVGPSAPSSASNEVTPALVVPDPPTSLVATPAGTSVSIAFTPGNDNGSDITNYQYSTNNGSTFSAFGPADAVSPVTISGLATNTLYNIQLKAVNAAGPSIASATVTTTTLTLANAPTISSIGRGVKTLTVNFTAPSNTGGSPIINYKYSTNNGGSYALMNPVNIDSPLTITTLSTDGTTLLANGTSYSIRIRAVTAAGDGTVSNLVSGTTLGVPSAPAITYVIPANTQVSVNFSAPSGDGGAAITSYTVTSSPGGFTASGASSPLTVTGLTNGTAYTFTATATNSVGPSAPSNASSSVTPSPLTRIAFFSGTGTWTVPIGVSSVNYLVVGGGGGGGGGGGTGAGGGGGGGSVKTGTLPVSTGASLSYTVGAGGTKGIGSNTTVTSGTAGGDSIFATFTAKGGGLGYSNGSRNSTNSFGRGGSAQSDDTPTTGGSGGNVRDGTPGGANGAGGGGGGAGGDGVTSVTANIDNTRGGAGGPGASSDLLEGIDRTYGAGGNGADEGRPEFIGWVGSSASGVNNGKPGTNGVANTGNGGGGGASHWLGNNGSDGGDGGSGIIVLTY